MNSANREAQDRMDGRDARRSMAAALDKIRSQLASWRWLEQQSERNKLLTKSRNGDRSSCCLRMRLLRQRDRRPR
ncbi:hypothetical protein VTK73DRAFT_8923 [Phialemonium thermophilum]|uniref:Uncharacterized protein n=1 Tax=Phialemonium thermophilum TaxID=223376 RepID=A0ABR3W5B0_9PEZI